MRENINKKIESGPKHNMITVFFMRHGQTKYLENSVANKNDLIINGKAPSDLTPEGEKEVKISAERIANKIDKDKDTVVFWGSPAWRAQGSEQIIREELEKRGITIHKDSTIKLMKDLEVYDKEYTVKFWDEVRDSGKSTDLVYARDPLLQGKNDKFETQPEVKKRAEQVIGHIKYLAEHLDLKDKRLCIIGVSHFEFLNPIMEDIFDHKIEDDRGIKKGEELIINFDFDQATKKLKIDADFRDEHKDDITNIK